MDRSSCQGPTTRLASVVAVVVPQLPMDILARLPVKTLLRFRSVCKAWRSVMTCHWLISAHQPQPSSSLLVFPVLMCRRPDDDHRRYAAAESNKSCGSMADLPVAATTRGDCNPRARRGRHARPRSGVVATCPATPSPTATASCWWPPRRATCTCSNRPRGRPRRCPGAPAAWRRPTSLATRRSGSGATLAPAPTRPPATSTAGC